MRQTLFILLAGLVAAATAASASELPRSPNASSFFLQCRLSNTLIKEGEKVEPEIRDYTFEVDFSAQQVRDLLRIGSFFTISKSSPGRIDAANKSGFYANSLVPGSDQAEMAINRVTGETYLYFYQTPDADEVRSCEARLGSSSSGYCHLARAVARHVGVCAPAKPRF
jgi:hypothetical protein